MEDETNEVSKQEEEVLETELDSLKLRADKMGIKYHPNIGTEKLKEKIEDSLKDESRKAQGNEDDAPLTKAQVTKPQTENDRRTALLKKAGRLRRIRVTCMNPMKSEWEGEIFTAGNGVVGNFKKYVPFDVDWHVPQIILDMMKDRMYQSFYTVKDPRTGQQGRRGKLVREFSIEMLPDLTKEELKALAQRQAMARGTAEA